jgi:hypothetical protein
LRGLEDPTHEPDLRRVKPADAAAIAEQFSDPTSSAARCSCPCQRGLGPAHRRHESAGAGSNEIVLAALLGDRPVGLAGLHSAGRRAPPLR